MIAKNAAPFNLKKSIGIVVFFAILLAFPLLGTSNYLITVGVNCLIFACFGLSWNLISGYGGQISWCHSSFAAIGAYTSVILFNRMGISPFLSLPLGMLLSFVLSTIIGFISFRYRGPFFSITTIALAELVRVLILHFADLTQGSRGINIKFSASFVNLLFSSNTPYFYIMIVLLAIMIVVTNIFEKSKTGYYLRLIANDEDAAITLGVPTSKVKLRTLQLSAILMSALGTFYAFFMMFIDPNVIAGLDLSIKIGSVAIIGGIATAWGPVVGAFIIIPLIELANVLLGQSGAAQFLYGAGIVLVVVLQPKGVLYFFNKESKVYKWFQKRFKKNSGGAE